MQKNVKKSDREVLTRTPFFGKFSIIWKFENKINIIRKLTKFRNTAHCQVSADSQCALLLKLKWACTLNYLIGIHNKRAFQPGLICSPVRSLPPSLTVCRCYYCHFYWPSNSAGVMKNVYVCVTFTVLILLWPSSVKVWRTRSIKRRALRRS